MIKRIGILLSFFIGPLQAMEPTKPTPQRDEESAAWHGLTPATRAVLHAARARQHLDAASQALMDGDRQLAGRARRSLRMRDDFVRRNVDAATRHTETELERATRINEASAHLFASALRDARLVEGLDPVSRDYLFDLHERLQGVLRNPEHPERGALLKVMCTHNPCGVTPPEFVTYALAVNHIVRGNADGRGGHILADEPALHEFDMQTRTYGAVLEESHVSHVVHGIRAGVGKTIFPKGASARDVVCEVLSILNDRRNVIMRKKIGDEGNRWSYLGLSKLWNCYLELKVDDDSRVVETAYPIFELIRFDSRKEKIPVLSLHDPENPARPRTVTLASKHLCAIAKELIKRYRDARGAWYEQLQETKRRGELPPVEPVLQDPVQYTDRGDCIVDVAPKLVENGWTHIDHGIYVRFDRDELEVPCASDL